MRQRTKSRRRGSIPLGAAASRNLCASTRKTTAGVRFPLALPHRATYAPALGKPLYPGWAAKSMQVCPMPMLQAIGFNVASPLLVTLAQPANHAIDATRSNRARYGKPLVKPTT